MNCLILYSLITLLIKINGEIYIVHLYALLYKTLFSNVLIVDNSIFELFSYNATYLH